MKLTIDSMNSTTGWSASSGSPAPSIVGLNQHRPFIAGNNSNSVIFKFPEGCINKYVTKSFSIDVSEYKDLVLQIWSRNKNRASFKKSSDYNYKVKINSGTEFYIETRNQLNYVSLDILSISSLTEITITALHDDEDYLIVSEIMAVKDEFPYDIFIALQEQLSLDVTSLLSNGILLGTVSTTIGDKEIDVDNYIGFLNRYSVIKITDGISSETHQVQEFDHGHCLLGTLFDGKEILNSFSSANVYLQIPVTFGNYEREIMLPSICVWGLAPEFILRGHKLESIFDSWNLSLGVSERQEGQILKFNILIDCEARETEMVALCSEIVRKFIGREKLWVNNRKLTVKFEGTPSNLEPTESYDIIPKIQYECSLELKEELWERAISPLITDTNIQVTPM